MTNIESLLGAHQLTSCQSNVQSVQTGPVGIVMNIKWDYSYYQPWSDNEWLVDEMLAMLDENITMQ